MKRKINVEKVFFMNCILIHLNIKTGFAVSILPNTEYIFRLASI